MWRKLPAMQPCLCAASPSAELCLVMPCFLHSPIRGGGASKPPPVPSPFFTSLWERGHRDFPGEPGSSIWTLSSLSLESCVPVTGADLSHILPLFVFRMGYLHTGEVALCSGRGLLQGSCWNAGEAQSHWWGCKWEWEGKAVGFNACLSLPACSSAAWEESYSQHMFLLGKNNPLQTQNLQCHGQICFFLQMMRPFFFFILFFGGFSFAFWFLNFFHTKFYTRSLEEMY